MPNVGAVIIGRNEGARLIRCLESVCPHARATVYVDSGSSDGSVEEARRRGAKVVELDTSRGFTAARARNAGFEHLLEACPDVDSVMFVDGDCEVDSAWWPQATENLEHYPEVAVVCGRRRERYPESTIYNRLCDLEWDTPVGEALACGGDAMMRRAAFEQVGGFRETLIAGEEPELCVRLRRNGWKILRMDAEMTLHDANMTRFSQWWKRSVRSGYAYAEGAALHGSSPQRHWVRETRSIWLWAAAMPLGIALAAWWLGAWWLLGLAVYPLLAARVYRYGRTRNMSRKDSLLYAAACVLIKWPQLVGQIMYWSHRSRGHQGKIIEYKGPDSQKNLAREVTHA